jgi:hypothetical protein
MSGPARPLTTYRLTHHARLEMARRQISEEKLGEPWPSRSKLRACGRAAYSIKHGWSGVIHLKPTCSGWLWTLIENHQRS